MSKSNARSICYERVRGGRGTKLPLTFNDGLARFLRLHRATKLLPNVGGTRWLEGI